MYTVITIHFIQKKSFEILLEPSSQLIRIGASWYQINHAFIENQESDYKKIFKRKKSNKILCFSFLVEEFNAHRNTESYLSITNEILYPTTESIFWLGFYLPLILG